MELQKSYLGLYKVVFILGTITLIHIYLTKIEDIRLTLASFIFLGFLYYQILLIVHELVHRTFLPNLKLNEYLGYVLSALLFLNFKKYRDYHFKHHAQKNILDDPDAKIYDKILKKKAGLPRIVALMFGGYSELFNKYIIMKGRESIDYKGVGFVLLIQSVLIICFFFLSTIIHYFVFWISPFFVLILLNRARLLVEHGWEHKKDGMQMVVNIKSNVIERLLLSPNNFNYHYEHHLHPDVPYYHLKNQFKTREGSEDVYIRDSYCRMLVHLLLWKK